MPRRWLLPESAPTILTVTGRRAVGQRRLGRDRHGQARAWPRWLARSCKRSIDQAIDQACISRACLGSAVAVPCRLQSRSRVSGQAPALGHAIQSQQSPPQGLGARFAIGLAPQDATQLGGHARAPSALAAGPAAAWPSAGRIEIKTKLLRLVVACGLCVGASAMAQTIKLRFGSIEPPGAPITARALTPWAKDVSAASGGTLDIEMYTGGTLGRNPMQQVKLLQDGVADFVWASPALTPVASAATKWSSCRSSYRTCVREDLPFGGSTSKGSSPAMTTSRC